MIARDTWWIIGIFGWWRWCLKQLLAYSDAVVLGSSRSSRCGCLVEVLCCYQRCVCQVLRGESAMTTLTSEGAMRVAPRLWAEHVQRFLARTRRFVDAFLQTRYWERSERFDSIWVCTKSWANFFPQMSRDFWDTEGLSSLLPWTRRFALVRALN